MARWSALAAILVTALCSTQGTDTGAEKKAVPSYRAESSAYAIDGKDGWTYVTENRSFRFVEVLGDDGNYEAVLLLEETYHNEHTDFIEGIRGTATVKAWTLKRGRQRELRWTFQEKGNEGAVQDRLFRIAAWGCCDIPVVYSYYNLLSGKKLYVSNSELLEVRGDGEGPLMSRYVAFGFDVINKQSQYPVLQYGTDKKIAQKFSIVSSKEYYEAPEIFVSANDKLEESLDLRGSPMNFVIVLKYLDGTELRIPVEADAIRPHKMALPQGYTIRLEN